MINKLSNGSTFLVLTLMLVIFTSSVPPFRAPPPTSADYCGIDPARLAQPPQHKVVIEVWASAPRQQCLRAYAPWWAAEQNPQLGLAVKVRANNINADPYRDELLAAAAQGKAPDISFLYHYQLSYLLKGDYLFPLEDCRKLPALREIPDRLWTTMSPDGKAWSVPFEIEAYLLYYNKAMLRQLGWSELALRQLPAQIASGEFDFNDLLHVAEAAVARGVTRAGLAFVPLPNQRNGTADLYSAFGGTLFDWQRKQFLLHQPTLQKTFTFLAALRRHDLMDSAFANENFNDWGNNVMVRDAVAHGRILFNHGYASDWQQMVMDYTNNEASKIALQGRIGVALLPVDDKSQAGRMFGYDLNGYVIFNEKATGRNNQDAACRLLAALHITNLAQHHADKASQPTVRGGEIVMPADWPQIGLQQIIWRPDAHPDFYATYARIVAEMAVAVEAGTMDPEAATLRVMAELQAELGDQLVVE